MTPRVQLLVATILLLLGRSAVAADVTSTWIGPQGEWTDGTLWSTNPLFPENGGLTYAAVVGDPLGLFANVNLSRDLTIDSLLLQNATLSTASTLSLLQGLTLGTNARLSGGTVVASGASLISGTGIRISSGFFVNQGDATWQSGDLQFLFGGGISNLAGGTFTVAGSESRSITELGGGLFLNEGNLIHSSTGTTQVATFANSGSVQVRAGSLRLSGSSLGGQYEIDPGATLRLGGGVVTDARISGAGDLELDRAFIDGVFATTGTTTFTRSGALRSSGNSTGALVVNSDYSGLRVDGGVSADGDFVWRGGRIFGAGTLDFGDELVIEGETDKILEGRELRADHGARWSAGTLGLTSGARLINGASSTMVLDASAGPIIASSAPGDGSIRNEGRLRKIGAGSALFQTLLDNVASVQVDEGLLQLGGLASSGALSIASGATLRLGGNSELTSGSSIDGLGTLALGPGTHSIRGAFAPGAVLVENFAEVHFLDPIATYSGAFSSTGGEVSFEGGPVDLTNVTALASAVALAAGSRIGGNYHWRLGSLASAGGVELYGNATLTQVVAAGAQLRNTGSLTVDSGFLRLASGANLLNASDGEFRFRGQVSNLLAEPGTSFRNQGLVVAEALPSGGGSVYFAAPLLNEGTIEIQGDGFASNAFQSTMSLGDFRQTAGTLWLNGGDIQTYSGAALRIDAGRVIGNGNLFVNVDSRGRIAPGDVGEAGRLTIQGLSLFEGSELEFELGGRQRGIDFDAIDVRSISLDGNLSIRFIDGFESTVTSSDVFEVARATVALQGVLDDVVSGARLATSDGLGSFAVFYGSGSPFAATSLVLTDFKPVPEPDTFALVVLVGVVTFWGRNARRLKGSAR